MGILRNSFGSLFSGIGGIDLGLERAGWNCRWQVENDEFCQIVLRKHWPKVAKFTDVRKIEGSELEPVELICGGFPCQPVSIAGKKQGKNDPRWLWPEFARIIGILRPNFVFMENVPGLFNLGFQEVLGSLASMRYDAEWDCIPASAFGALHRRYRIVLVAYSNCSRFRRDEPQNEIYNAQIQTRVEPFDDSGEGSDHSTVLANAISKGLEGSRSISIQTPLAESSVDGIVMADTESDRFQGSRLQLRSRKQKEASREFDGKSKKIAYPKRKHNGRIFQRRIRQSSFWSVEPNVGRVAYGVSDRVDRLRGLGNAVVPQVAEWVGKEILRWKKEN